MGEHSEVYVAFDTAKLKHAVAIAEAGREGEVRFLGEVENRPAVIERLIKKLGRRYRKLHICFEAGPTGYGLYRQVQALGHNCLVVAPALIPRRAGERVKTNRRDALTLARLYRAGELSAVWVPDDVHEAVRDLVRGRTTAAEDVRRKRQQFCRSYCGMAGSSPAEIIGPVRIGAGWPSNASIILRSRLSSRTRLRQSRTPSSACTDWKGSSAMLFPSGRWLRWSPLTKPCAACRSWSP